MIKIYYLVWCICCVTVIGGLKAQDKENDIARQTKTFLNSCNKNIFVSNPDVDSLHIDFENGVPELVTFYLRTDSTDRSWEQYRKWFDLKFEGDLYVLDNALLENLFVRSEIESDYIDSIQSLVKYHRLSAKVYPDSTIYYFKYFPIYHAMYKGDINNLKNKLEDNYIKDTQVVPGDSVLIFQGIVEREGILTSVALVTGEQSEYAESVKRGIESQHDSWIPYTKDGIPYRSLVDIYVRINSNGSFTVAETGRVRNVKITDYDKRLTLFR